MHSFPWRDLRWDSYIYHERGKIFAPALMLVGAYYRKDISWEEFEERYLWYLREPSMKAHVRNLAANALQKDITLLCIEKSSEHCHRRLLAEECKKLVPELKVGYR